MICKDYISGYCKQAIEYKKYAEYRRCDRCCIDCLEPCSYLCRKALEIINKTIEGGEL